MKIKKLVIGVRPAAKMFRLSSQSGSVIDAVLDLRGGKVIDDDFFAEVSRNGDNAALGLKNESGSNSLRIDMENIVFAKSTYGGDKSVVFESALEEFFEIWAAVNGVLKIQKIRRIGIVAEHRVAVEKKGTVSSLLLEKCTNFKSIHVPGQFVLRYEERRRTADGGLPDATKSDFVNVIRDIYDSSRDADVPEEDCINLNLDVQRYYAPVLNTLSLADIQKLKKTLDEERKRFDLDLSGRGVI